MIEPEQGTEGPSRKADAPTGPALQATRIQTQPGKAPPVPSQPHLGLLRERACGQADGRPGDVVEHCCPFTCWSSLLTQVGPGPWGHTLFRALATTCGSLMARGPMPQPQEECVFGAHLPAVSGPPGA